METCAFCGSPVMVSEFTARASGTTKDGRTLWFDFCTVICLDGWVIRTRSKVTQEMVS